MRETRETEQHQQNDEGWTKKDQQQEPEPKGEGSACRDLLRGPYACACNRALGGHEYDCPEGGPICPTTDQPCAYPCASDRDCSIMLGGAK